MVTILIAINQSGEVVFLNGKKTHQELLSFKKNNRFHCPQCKQKVFLKVGTIKIAHFAHAAKETCSSFSEPESLVHIQAKLQLYHWLSEKHLTVEMEKNYRLFNQRADIGLSVNGKEFAIEFQRSALTSTHFLNRTLGYYNHGIIPLWLLSHDRLSAPKPHKISLTSFHQQFIRYSKTLKQFYLLSYDVQSMSFIIYQLYFPLTKTTFTYSVSIIPLKNIHFPQFPLVKLHLTEQKLNPFLKYRVKWGDSRLLYGKGHVDPLLQRMYSSGLSVQLLPPWVGLPVRGAIEINETLMEWQSFLYVFIHNRSVSNCPFLLTDISSYINDFITSRKIACSPFELSRKIDKPAIIQYVELLVKMKILNREDDYFSLNENNPFTKIEHIQHKERIYDRFHQEVTQVIIDHYNCSGL
ncbi:hypothetical protein E2R51_06265 [Jeotgalibacillus sp. S-D1]|uniref:competence protein CoiA n=1 Tax=Jeotgalibacillus sp. S-D1 TaxID=2552189 RepID=UPI001059E267|nr:competence protein CoiA family protein [Jeotgalibacillus sp. S-D1]TDL35312.1 hypothetical protein E2R51_06265 [Jeotgalibacillus sp. S-D1]